MARQNFVVTGSCKMNRNIIHVGRQRSLPCLWQLHGWSWLKGSVKLILLSIKRCSHRSTSHRTVRSSQFWSFRSNLPVSTVLAALQFVDLYVLLIYSTVCTYCTWQIQSDFPKDLLAGRFRIMQDILFLNIPCAFKKYTGASRTFFFICTVVRGFFIKTREV